jgi:hypothetical protein
MKNRKRIKNSVLRAACDATVTPLLLENGFERNSDGEFIRFVSDGEDGIFIWVDRTRTSASIEVSYSPDYMKFIYEMYGIPERESGGRLVPCFLTPGTPGTVASNHRPWKFDNEEKVFRAFEQIRKALEQIGLPWLEKMHSPEFYASKTDQVAAFSSAVAFDAAGDYVKARELYKLKRQAHEQCLTIGNPKRAERFFTEQSRNGKEFVFVAHKLGLVDSFCEKLMEIHDYRPDFLTLPT